MRCLNHIVLTSEETHYISMFETYAVLRGEINTSVALVTFDYCLEKGTYSIDFTYYSGEETRVRCSTSKAELYGHVAGFVSGYRIAESICAKD